MVTRWVHPLAFHQYRWWKPVRGGPAWFYGTPRRGPTRGSRVVDLSTVDAPLRSLVGELHDRGFGTTGSCSGHFPTASWCERAWARLGQDAQAIRRGGLRLHDVESGVERVLHDRSWRVVARQQFVQDTLSSAGKGALGITGIQPEDRARLLMQARRQGIGANLLGPDGILFVVHGKDVAELGHGWSALRRILETAGTGVKA